MYMYNYFIVKINFIDFQLVFQIQFGTIDQKDVDTEWKLKPYMNTAKKRLTLSDNKQ